MFLLFVGRFFADVLHQSLLISRTENITFAEWSRLISTTDSSFSSTFGSGDAFDLHRTVTSVLEVIQIHKMSDNLIASTFAADCGMWLVS